MADALTYAIFLLVTFASLLYVVCANRVIDGFTVAIPSSVLFFLSAYFRVVTGHSSLPALPANGVMYGAYAVFLLSLLTAAVFNDRTVARNRKPVVEPVTRIGTATWVGISGVLAGLAMLNADQYFSGSKGELQSLGSILPMTYKISALVSISLLLAWRRTSLTALAVVMLLALVSLLMGQRSAIALAGISFLLIWGKQVGRVSLALRFPILTFIYAPIAVLLACLAKPLYGAARSGNWDNFWSNLFGSFWNTVVSGAEFTRTQYQFAEVIRTGFTTDGGHVWRAFFSILPLPRSWYTTPSSEFNDLFQPVLFPNVPGGMAYNPFSEMYSAFGFLGIVTFSFVYSICLFALNGLFFKKRNMYIVVFLSILMAYLAFYMHRNSAATILALLRNIVWPMLGVGMLSAIIAFGVRSRGRVRTT